MLKALKWLVIFVVGAFTALFALGVVIEANKSPEEKAADEAARRAAPAEEAATAVKPDEQNQEAAAEEAPTEEVSEQSEPTLPQEHETQDIDRSEGRVTSVIDKVKSIAADAEWQFTSRESPFDGSIYQASKAFESEEYAAEVTVQLRCVEARKDLSLVFISHVYDSDGNTLPSSAFGNTWDISGEPFATQGRVKWSNRKPQPFTAMLGEHSNVAVFNNDNIVEAAGAAGLSPSEALESLLPAYFELSNGAGDFTISIPRDNSSISKVLAGCK